MVARYILLFGRSGQYILHRENERLGDQGRMLHTTRGNDCKPPTLLHNFWCSFRGRILPGQTVTGLFAALPVHVYAAQGRQST